MYAVSPEYMDDLGAEVTQGHMVGEEDTQVTVLHLHWTHILALALDRISI